MKKLAAILTVLVIAGVAQAAVIYSEDFSTGTVGNPLTAAPLSWLPQAGNSPVVANANPVSTGGGNYAENDASAWGRNWYKGSLKADISAETKGIHFSCLAGVQDVSGAAAGDTSDVGLVSDAGVNIRRLKFQYHQDAVQNPGLPNEKPGGWELLYNGTTIYNFGGIFAGGTGANDAERYEFELWASLVPGVGITASVTPVGGSATSVFIADGDLVSGWYNDIGAVRIAGGSNSKAPIAVDDLLIETIPEPATLAVLALGGLAALIGRRRY